jgi:hypothetical protein
MEDVIPSHQSLEGVEKLRREGRAGISSKFYKCVCLEAGVTRLCK